MAGQSRKVGASRTCVFAAAADELLDGLRAVEDAGGGLGDDGEAALAVGDDHVALVVHGGVEAR
jgi:hypothetical protein